jgi:DnaJ-domain-containing protein 1
VPFLALGAVALLLVVWFTNGKPLFQHREWRLTSAGFAIAAFAAAAYVALREAWLPALVLVVLGLWLAVSARRPGAAAPPRQPSARMSLDEARSVLGVEEGATPAQIKAAYTRLMRMAHPDKGGTAGLAAQLNAARERLLEG